MAAVVFFVSPIGRPVFDDLFNKNPNQQPPVSAPPEQDALACVTALPDTVKIGQKLMFAAYAGHLSAETPVLVAAHIGGVIVMDAIPTTQLSDLKASANIPPLIGVDQEGGAIQRYTAEGRIPSAAEMASNFSVAEAYDTYLADDKYLQSLGITTNFAPVVDVMSGAYNPLPGRLYSSDADTVAAYAGASIRAARDAGITPVIKHFPGLGSATGNTDYGSATTDPLSVLQARDLVPYRNLADSGADVMVSNAIVPELTDGQPAVWSSAALRLLRDMGYQKAVVYSDSLTARAVSGTLADAAVKAWQAGVDVALIVQTKEATPQLNELIETITASAAVALRSGALDNAEFSRSVLRIFERKGVDACTVGGTVSVLH